MASGNPCLWKSLDSIHVGNENFFHPTVLQFGDNLKPEFGSLVFRSLHAKDFFDTIYTNADSKIDCLTGWT
jgi:hypothetical protein